MATGKDLVRALNFTFCLFSQTLLYVDDDMIICSAGLAEWKLGIPSVPRRGLPARGPRSGLRLSGPEPGWHYPFPGR